MDAQQSAGDIAGQLKRILQFPYSSPHLLCVFSDFFALHLSLSLSPPPQESTDLLEEKLSAALREEEGLCSELD
jgi:hypothetical protein